MPLNNFLPFKITLLILNFFALTASAQTPDNDYKQNWQKVKNLEEKGLTTSAIAEVEIIYHLAKKDQNQAQIIKSLLYKNLLYQNITEDATKKMIDTLQQEIVHAPEPAKSILLSITAQLYENYFSYNRYRLYAVSQTEGFQKDDIATWSADDFRNKIASLYEASIQNKQLQRISLEPFNAIITKGNVQYLRPTLFDLLAHRALDYFKSSENDIARPSYTFEITNPGAFSPAVDFTHQHFETRDSSSLYWKALRIYQELIQFHLKETEALIDVDLDRLAFVNQHAVIPEKKQLYIQALKNIFLTYKDKSAAEAGFRWASEISQSTDEQEGYKKAARVKETMDILILVINQYPGSEGAIHAYNLLEQLRHPSLSLLTEKVNVVNKPFRALVTYSNLNSIYLRIIPITKKQKEQIRATGSTEEEFKKITSLKFSREWKQELPYIKDYLNHSVEIKIDGMPYGEYILIASKDADFSQGKNLMAANYLFVSDISFVNKGKDYFVLNRESGMPVTDATAKVLLKNYNYQTRKYNLVQVATLQSDKNGYFRIPDNVPDNAYNLQLDISTPKDRLFLDDIQRTYLYEPALDLTKYQNQEELDKQKASVFYFTDRSIYRPGQTVYYKGIAVTQDLATLKWKLLPSNTSVLIYLLNGNGEKIDSTTATLNEYGSFNGKFILPENQLTGSFTISSPEYPRQVQSFSVEEYKRPKFFAEFEKAKETYQVNDTVTITGRAEAYAGNRIDGAQVKYRVVRKARFIYPWYFWRTGLPNVSPLEITHGETITDENGQFKIDFKAIPDLKIAASTDPVFDYEITADITDINGETRSAATIIPIGYKALNMQIGLSDKATFLAGNLDQITLNAINLSGEPQEVKAQVKVYQLKTPDRVMRQRLWQVPDTSVMTRAQFINFFPHDVFKDEDNPETWERLATILDREDSIHGTTKIKIPKQLKTGWYVVEAESEDRYGNPVKDIKYIRVLQPSDKKTNLSDYMVSITENKKYEPGGNAMVYLASAADIYLIQQKDTIKTMAKADKPDFKYNRINNTIKPFTFPVTENDLGGFGIVQFFVKDNRFYYTKSTVDVPWYNKQLDITFDTYREKTLPGSEETWIVKISGNKGEKLAAEMLASMYDESLDQFRPHTWNKINPWPVYQNYNSWQGYQNFTSINSFNLSFSPDSKEIKEKTYANLSYSNWPIRYKKVSFAMTAPRAVADREIVLDNAAAPQAAPAEAEGSGIAADSASLQRSLSNEKKELGEPATGSIRTNFNETAFFMPDLKTDKHGNIHFSFTMPEALTKWKLMALAHTQDLATGYAEASVVTQKDLMVIPNVPRFLREGDQMQFSAKVVNMSDKEMTTKVEFHLLNAETLLPVDRWFNNDTSTQSVIIPANQSKPVSFKIEVPKGFNDLVVYRIVGTAENISDGEEAYIPVLTNRMLVTESMPLEMSETGTKKFSFEKLLKSGQQKTLTNFGLTIEYTPNPAWYAVQALPYLNEYPYDCTEQVFNRYFANALAMHIANSTPKLQTIFNQWKNPDTSALMSNLQKNQELKSILLEETPWIVQAKSEEQQKKNIALLFDLHNMAGQLSKSLQTVSDRQSPNGGFVWFKGGPDDRYMTQYILSDIGHLKRLNAWPEQNAKDLLSMATKALRYSDSRINEDFQKLKKSKLKMDDNNLSTIAVYYLYARSFFPESAISPDAKEAYNYYLGQAKKYWLKQGIYMQGMIALTLFRKGDIITANDIVRSLKENAITDKSLGMYWKEWTRGSWWWYQAPIESQALMIEVFSEITKDESTVGELKKWLLKNKQTNNWKTTKSTAEAVYALLLQGSELFSEEKNVEIRLGNMVMSSRGEKQEAGTGYFKRRIDGSRVTPEMGNIAVTVTSAEQAEKKPSLSWGSVYWQYMEDMDKITFAETPLQLSKKLFVERNTDRGPVLTPVKDGDILHIGDKIKVRIELRADRDMEYVHMKDMRASATEPVNVLSQYKWQGGLGYYESTKDAGTNFFFNYLPKGTYVFEYPLFVTHAGDFSNGITTIQCMYAPEFTAHSEGIRIRIE